MDNNHQTTGLELKLERIARRVKANCVAREMKVSPSRVNAIENLAVVTPAAAARYRQALTTCATFTTGS